MIVSCSQCGGLQTTKPLESFAGRPCKCPIQPKPIKSYPNMTPIFSAIADRDEHRRLILAVVEAANPWAKAWATMGSSPTDSEEHALAQAVFALLHFEELQGK